MKNSSKSRLNACYFSLKNILKREIYIVALKESVKSNKTSINAVCIEKIHKTAYYFMKYLKALIPFKIIKKRKKKYY